MNHTLLLRAQRARWLLACFVSRLLRALRASLSTLAVTTLALAFAGCGTLDDEDTIDDPFAQQNTAVSRSGPVIVVLGSSTAAGVGASWSNQWVERYRAYLRQNFSNFQLVVLAAGGATTYDIQPSDYTPPPSRPSPAPSRNITHALSLNPSAIIINLPSNDQQARFSVDEQMANYERVASLAAARGVLLWVTTPQPRNFADASQRNSLQATRAALYGRYGDRTIDFWNGLANADGTINAAYDCGDGTHLNDSGHRLLAERVQWARVPQAVLGR